MRNTIKRAAEPIAAVVAILALMAAMLMLNSCGTTAADSPPVPPKPAVVAPASVGSVAAAQPTIAAAPTPTDLQAALQAALAAKAALDKASADLAAAKVAVDTGTTAYATALQVYYDLANTVLPPPAPKPLNPDGVTADEVMIVYAGGTAHPWEAAEVQSAIKAAGMVAFVIDTTAADNSAVDKRWIQWAQQTGPLPWLGLVKMDAKTGASSVVYYCRADDGKLLDVIRAFAHPKATAKEEDGAEPDPIPTGPPTGLGGWQGWMKGGK